MSFNITLYKNCTDNGTKRKYTNSQSVLYLNPLRINKNIILENRKHTQIRIVAMLGCKLLNFNHQLSGA